MQLPDNLKEKIEPIIRSAGKILRSFFRGPCKQQTKQNNSVVTEADFASEKYLLEQLHSLLPEAKFCAEESGNTGNGVSQYEWVIDPLDGTSNFARGLPYFCISVALTYEGLPVLGAIYQPLTDEFFWAQKGKGAWCNGNKLSVSAMPRLQDCLIILALPYIEGDKLIPIVRKISQLQGKVRGMRYLGAAALDMAYVAAGRIDALLLTNLEWWDIAAGLLLIQEAGGIVTDFSNKVITRDYSTLLSACPETHRELLGVLQ